MEKNNIGNFSKIQRRINKVIIELRDINRDLDRLREIVKYSPNKSESFNEQPLKVKALNPTTQQVQTGSDIHSIYPNIDFTKGCGEELDLTYDDGDRYIKESGTCGYGGVLCRKCFNSQQDIKQVSGNPDKSCVQEFGKGVCKETKHSEHNPVDTLTINKDDLIQLIKNLKQ